MGGHRLPPLTVRRFVVSPDQISGDVAHLSAAEARHALTVLRMADGEKLLLSDGRACYEAALDLSDGTARAHLLGSLPSAESPARITLYQGYPKADKLEWIVQKGTELGVTRFVPVVLARSVARPSGDAGKKTERLARIAQEAVKQCGRTAIPDIAEPIALQKALPSMARHELLLTPWEEARELRLQDAYRERPDARDIGLVIGPEGGIEPSEIDALRAVGALPVTLGPRILRAETAAISCVALIQGLWGDLT